MQTAIPIYQCDGCGKKIQGKHVMTWKDSWVKAGGFGSPPPKAILHGCNDKCLRKAEAKDNAKIKA